MLAKRLGKNNWRERIKRQAWSFSLDTIVKNMKKIFVYQMGKDSLQNFNQIPRSRLR